MSGANTVIVKDIYRAFQEGRPADIVARMADRLTFLQPGGEALPWSGDYPTREAVGDFFTRLAAAANVEAFEPTAYVEEGNAVAAFGRWKGKAAASGKPFACDWAMRWELQDGRVTFFQSFLDTAVIAPAFA